MAEIRIIGNIETTTTVNRFREEDLAIISSKNERNNFGLKEDYIEYFIYDVGGSLLNINYNYVDFKSAPNVGLDENGEIKYIEIDPIRDLQNTGYSTGELTVQYNFFRKKISDELEEALFIKEISPDRTEIRVGSAVLTNEQIEKATLSLIDEINKASYYKTYLTNFGVNQQFVVVNVALNKTTDNYEIFLKLYEPLPEVYSEKATFWLVDEIIEPYTFTINLDRLIIPDPLPQIGGPNFDIELPDRNTITTQYQSYTDLLTNTSGSTYQQFLSFIASQSIDINVDYTNLNNFVKFSSAAKRIEVFYNKVSDIQTYQASINAISATASLAGEVARLSSSINDIISNFDGFEYYLYFESGSVTSSVDYYITPYPKSTSTKPFTLYSTASATTTTWLNYSLTQSLAYDADNLNNLEGTIPLYIREDDNNTNYITYINMIGHYFDNIWIYLKSVTDLYKSYNNLEDGVSKDLVYYALNSLGFKTYNSKESAELFDYIVGANTGSANFDNNFTATGSYLNNIPRQDLLSETYKRIYHNISLLFKSKGSVQGINFLNNIFGITSSILDVREYGGTNKSQYLKGYNPDKIRIATNTITGSLLSPFIGLEMKETASANMLNIDYHKVDIGFSPQNQIDAAVSSSVGSFNIDNYIGDPLLAYSSSYSSLDTFRKTTFDTVFDYAFDYSGFIRLIKFFDNTLFKTFKDFSPGRNNTSTGVIFRSPQLERNKVQQTKPNVAYHTIQDASYSIAGISEDKSYMWSLLSGNRAGFYTGELPTTMSSVNYYFEYTNPNPYLLGYPTVKLPTVTGSNVYNYIDSNRFEHTDFNVTLNNVSSSRLSIIRKELETIYTSSDGYLKVAGYSSSYYAELQDSYLSLKAHQLSRYEGVKTKSLLYNTYTSASDSYEGDQSFGKTAAIDKQVEKLGLFSQIVESQFLPNRNNVRLKYLVDQNGELTELNQRNKHWEEVQRTFIAGDNLDVSLFDNQKYGNQKLTDGTKPIFESGYIYYPILYFGDDEKIYFENRNTTPSSYLVTAINGITPLSINGFPTNNYPIDGNGNVFNIFNTAPGNPSYFYTGSLTAFPTYSVQEAGNYRISANFDITINYPLGGTSTWALTLLKNGTELRKDTKTIAATAGVTASVSDSNIYSFNSTIATSSLVTSNKPVLISSTTYPVGTQFYKWVFPGYANLSGCSLSGYSGIWYTIAAGSPTSFTGILNPCTGSGFGFPRFYDYILATTFYVINGLEDPVGDLTQTLSVNVFPENPVEAIIGDQFTLELSQSYVSVANYTASISQGNLTIGSLAVATGYSEISTPFFNTSSLSASLSTTSSFDNSHIIFSPGISSFYETNYQFVPNPLTGSQNSLYNIYGDVDYDFRIKPFDILLTYLSDSTYIESRILSTSISSSCLLLHLDNQLSEFYINNLISGSYQRFLLLTRVEDETNAYITYRKRPGPTSYGFTIPSNIHPDVLDNIDTITKEVKQKLIELGGIDGGTL